MIRITSGGSRHLVYYGQPTILLIQSRPVQINSHHFQHPRACDDEVPPYSCGHRGCRHLRPPSKYKSIRSSAARAWGCHGHLPHHCRSSCSQSSHPCRISEFDALVLTWYLKAGDDPNKIASAITATAMKLCSIIACTSPGDVCKCATNPETLKNGTDNMWSVPYYDAEVSSINQGDLKIIIEESTFPRANSLFTREALIKLVAGKKYDMKCGPPWQFRITDALPEIAATTAKDKKNQFTSPDYVGPYHNIPDIIDVTIGTKPNEFARMKLRFEMQGALMRAWGVMDCPATRSAVEDKTKELMPSIEYAFGYYGVFNYEPGYTGSIQCINQNVNEGRYKKSG
ncbi:hypothetical protein BDV95DRAFT_248932 [Massariosphaeria phaeospora]|uniref:Uncharacterized protein n=1 Tax=Massariosphaeria phaeospora TaxID=100035 RepID=A0A7C8I1U2_9PLEO|nr:hypothetical protein BDV95DRAFT_248932 [Massariosphaeria phaeospora]